ncbi:hypothetical protein [Haliscomenobacter sp.]|uniref:hypothetical protein n=1 Tax=Haliscomenobacter sp. TaxID=2717303 RepID=UPI0035944D96
MDFAQTDEGLNTAFIEADRHNWTKEERIAYDNVAIKEADEKQEKIMVAEKAHEKGMEEGKMEMILGMHEEGLSVPQIAKVSKKTEEEVAQIIENHKNKKS